MALRRAMMRNKPVQAVNRPTGTTSDDGTGQGKGRRAPHTMQTTSTPTPNKSEEA